MTGVQNRRAAQTFALIAFLVLGSLVLVACSTSEPTGNVVKRELPKRVCSIQGLTCLVTASGPGTISFTVRNNGQTELIDLSLAIDTNSCVLSPASVAISRLPGGAQDSVRFTCAQPVDAFDGRIRVLYATRTDPTIRTAAGTITIREG